MALTSAIEAYKDVEAKLQEAMIHAPNHMVLAFATEAKAVQWRQRASYFRRLVRESTKLGISPYDHFVFAKEGSKIIIRTQETGIVEAFVVTPDGEVVTRLEDKPEPTQEPVVVPMSPHDHLANRDEDAV